MTHNFKQFPELPNSIFNSEYFNSPHKQIMDNFKAEVVKVHDGDTITLKTDFRDFNFPLRIVNIDAPELNAAGGKEAREFLKEMIGGQLVDIIIDKEKRVEKYGRLLGDVLFMGLLVSRVMVNNGYAWRFAQRRPGELPNIQKELNIEKWLGK